MRNGVMRSGVMRSGVMRSGVMRSGVLAGARVRCQRRDRATERARDYRVGSMLWVQLFHAAGATVHVVVDPKQARRFGEWLCSSQAKDDARDARTLTELVLCLRNSNPYFGP